MRLRRLVSAVAVAFCAAAAGAHAQDYPNRNVRIVVGFAAGGASDTLARVVGPRLAEAWGQNVLVDNRIGAGGTIGANTVVRANADGHTIFLGDFGPSVLAGSLYDKLSYDPANDFIHVVRMVTFPLVLLVPAGSPITSTKELIDQARAKPGAIRYSSAGVGTSPHMFIEMMNLMARVNTVPIQYKGGAPAVVALLSGEVEYSMVSVSTALGQLGAGKIRALGVTSAKPVGRLPNVPPMANAIPGYDAVSFYGLHAPLRTPAAIVTKISGDVTKVLLRPDVKERLDSLGLDVAPMPPKEFDAFVRSQIKTWGAVAKAANVKAE